jgi:hypothetical protein
MLDFSQMQGLSQQEGSPHCFLWPTNAMQNGSFADTVGGWINAASSFFKHLSLKPQKMPRNGCQE